jgi:hypothetical protein
MTTGRNNKLVGATGEYLVAAELSRRGMIATTFTGNVPHYDIIASDETGRHVSVQVKASRGTSWQFADISLYCDLAFEDQKQVVGTKKSCPVRDLVMVFVHVGEQGNDRFYIIPWERFRDIIVQHHTAFLAKHNGVRPKQWRSRHSAIAESNLAPFRDKWESIEYALK